MWSDVHSVLIAGTTQDPKVLCAVQTEVIAYRSLTWWLATRNLRRQAQPFEVCIVCRYKFCLIYGHRLPDRVPHLRSPIESLVGPITLNTGIVRSVAASSVRLGGRTFRSPLTIPMSVRSVVDPAGIEPAS